MSFWILENTIDDYCTIHQGNCYHCNDGEELKPKHIGRWRGDYSSYKEAKAVAESVGKPIIICEHCNPKA